MTLVLAACSTVPSSTGRDAAGGTEARSFVYATGVWLADRQGTDCRLELRGAVDNAAVRQAGAALDWVEQAGCRTKTLVLNTGPGVFNDAITLGAMARNRNYHTQVAAGVACSTPCLLVFAAGQDRAMVQQPTPARLVFTQIPPDQDFGRQVCQTELSRGQQLTLLRYVRAMLPPATARALYLKLEGADCQTPDSYGPAEALAMGLATVLRPACGDCSP